MEGDASGVISHHVRDATRPDRNLALELVRVTEAAALAAARWVGRGEKEEADQAAVDAMRLMLDTVPMDGVPDVPRTLHGWGYRLAVASSSALGVIRVTVETLGLVPLFEALVSGADLGRGKPAPDVFVETARRLGLPPSACLVVEDSRNGLLAAKAAGMACAAIPCPATRHEDFSEADFRLGALPELLPILR